MESNTNPKKRGPKAGSKNNTNNKTRLDWFKVCDDWSSTGLEFMSKKTFLESDLTSLKFSGTKSEVRSMSMYLKQYKDGGLLGSEPDNFTRKRAPLFPEVEKNLMAYLDLRSEKYQHDKCGILWLLLRAKALAYAKKLQVTKPFTASDGWISNFLNRHNLTGISLHGEAGDMSAEERKETMEKWRTQKFEPALKWLAEDDGNIGEQMDRIYNADQTGLFHQKLPNRIYVHKDSKKSFSGAKQMKDKTRITIMLCTAASGRKQPLAVIGKSKNPRCFKHLPDKKPPMAYRNQWRAWFDKDVTLWWLVDVFIRDHKEKHGTRRAILLLDNCPAHKIDMSILPYWLKIVFFPPNVTNTHQPADMGMIAALKVGYRTKMLSILLGIFDTEGGFEEAARQDFRKILFVFTISLCSATSHITRM